MALSTCLWNVAKRDENFIENKKNGGWLRYFNVSRRISSSFLLLLWKSDGAFEERKAMGVVHCTCICLTLNTRLREFYKNSFLKFFFLCVFTLTYENLDLFCRRILSFKRLNSFFMFNFSQRLVKLFFKKNIK